MLTWPSILKPSSGGFAPFVRSLGGGQSLSGFEQVQPQFHDRWSASFQIAIKNAEQNRAMRSMLTQLRGRAGTVGLPLFERIRPPRATDTPGSPIGTSVSNPLFASLSSVFGSPVGNSYSNPTFSRLAYQYGPPVGNSYSNPVVADRWPQLADTAFEYTTNAGVTGTALIEGPSRVRYAPTGDEPSVGQYITLLSERHRILSTLNDGSDRILTVSPGFDVSSEDQYATVSGTTGTVLVETNSRIRFTPTGTAPAVGQYVTLLSVRRRIDSITNDGSDRILTISPSFEALASDQYTTLSGITGTAIIDGANRVRFTPTGTQPAVGQYVTLLSVRRKIEAILNDGSDRILHVSPGFTIGSTTPGALTATVAADTDLNDTTIDIGFAAGGPPVAGTRFSVGARLYQIDGVTDLGGSVYRCTIWPWLRADVTSGTTANFTTPVCEMRLASDQEGTDALRSLDLLKFGNVSLSFDEASAT